MSYGDIEGVFEIDYAFMNWYEFEYGKIQGRE
jgi:hypothetical protein